MGLTNYNFHTRSPKGSIRMISGNDVKPRCAPQHFKQKTRGHLK